MATSREHAETILSSDYNMIKIIKFIDLPTKSEMLHAIDNPIKV